MTRKPVSFRLPDEVRDHLGAISRLTTTSRTELLTGMIEGLYDALITRPTARIHGKRFRQPAGHDADGE